MNDILKHTIRFFILASIQILVLNNVQISGYINPFVYILFIMLLPPKMPKAIVLILAFIMGFTIDVFSDSYGIHSSATVLLAFFRPKVLALVSVKGGEDLEAIEKNGTLASPAMALAKRVLPVPGGPTISTP